MDPPQLDVLFPFSILRVMQSFSRMQGHLPCDLGIKDSLAHTEDVSLSIWQETFPFPSTETYKKRLQFCFMILNSHRTHPCCVCVSSYDTGARSLLRTPAMLLFCLPTLVINNSSNKCLLSQGQSPSVVPLHSKPQTFQTSLSTNQALYIRRNKERPCLKGDLLNVMFWPQPMDGASTDVCMCLTTHTHTHTHTHTPNKLIN